MASGLALAFGFLPAESGGKPPQSIKARANFEL